MLAVMSEPSRINRFFLISFLIHGAAFAAAYIYFYAMPEPESYVASVAMYLGEGELDRPTTGKGKGDKNADPNQKRDDSIGTGQSNSSSNVDWGTASDPAIEGGSRYNPQIWIDGNLEDFYPPRARQSNLGKVAVLMTVYVNDKGQILDVRIRGVRSTGNVHKPFEADFIAAARQIALTRMRLGTAGYKKDGRPVHFKWDFPIYFSLAN